MFSDFIKIDKSFWAGHDYKNIRIMFDGGLGEMADETMAFNLLFFLGEKKFTKDDKLDVFITEKDITPNPWTIKEFLASIPTVEDSLHIIFNTSFGYKMTHEDFLDTTWLSEHKKVFGGAPSYHKSKNDDFKGIIKTSLIPYTNIFMDSVNNNTIVIMGIGKELDKRKMVLYHGIQALLPFLLPWYCDTAPKELIGVRKELLLSMLETDAKEYNSLVERIVSSSISETITVGEGNVV